MTEKPKSRWQGVRRNVRNRLLSGMIVLVPVGITLLVMRWVLQWMAGFFQPSVEMLALRLAEKVGMANIPPEALEVPLMVVSIFVFLLAVYLAGALAQAVIGRRLISAGETVLMRVPLARSIYSAAKQVMEAVATPTRAALRTVVLVQFPRIGMWSVGFLTGRVVEAEEHGLMKVFVPTTPNPTTGFFVILPHEDVVMTDLAVEEAFKMIISGGIVSPAALEGRFPAPPRTLEGPGTG